MKKILFVCIFCTLLFSCKKSNQEDAIVLQNGNLYHGNYKSSLTNPYDYIGQLHNEVLTAIGEMPNFPNIKEEDMGNYMLSYMDSIGVGNTEHDLSYFNSMYEVLDENKSISILAIELNKDKEINEFQLYYLEKLDTVIISNINDNEIYNSKLSEIERVLKEDNNLSDENKIPIWEAFSIARYSGNFWNDARINSKNPWYKIYYTSKGVPIYTGTKIGEAWADTKGWVKGLFTHCDGGCFHCAHVGSFNASRRYVVDHIVFEK